ncbi:SoxR reducing system RseC family protein [Dechloromonas sp. H13]|uniref:SoxR reducing system RseC family protein n=1 Tax=Dechloromonas sp. H13 TaxID=2570193 RepID=UPI001290D3BD|nr:SoxR reducing system RseC family protein [Dechloromonas sp. H13]
MNTEQQSTVRAIVRELDGDSALVEVEQGGCGRCHEKGGCGGQQLTQMFCSGPRHYRVANDVGARVGDQVTVAVAAGSLRKSANLAYILPLTATIAGAVLGMPLGGDPGAMIGAVAGLVMAFLYVRRQAARRVDDPAFHPHIVSHSS